MGLRPWDRKTKKFGEYVWEDYATIDARRKNFGSGIVQLHEKLGKTGKQYGVGIWAANRPEWQITGMYRIILEQLDGF